MSSKTPITDACEKNFGEMPGQMRRMELELAEARRKIVNLRDLLNDVYYHMQLCESADSFDPELYDRVKREVEL